MCELAIHLLANRAHCKENKMSMTGTRTRMRAPKQDANKNKKENAAMMMTMTMTMTKLHKNAAGWFVIVGMIMLVLSDMAGVCSAADDDGKSNLVNVQWQAIGTCFVGDEVCGARNLHEVQRCLERQARQVA